jgi:hypothetical protein
VKRIFFNYIDTLASQDISTRQILRPENNGFAFLSEYCTHVVTGIGDVHLSYLHSDFMSILGDMPIIYNR